MSTMTTMSTERFIYRKKLAHLREQLARTDDEAACQQIVKMIEEEEANKPDR